MYFFYNSRRLPGVNLHCFRMNSPGEVSVYLERYGSFFYLFIEVDTNGFGIGMNSVSYKSTIRLFTRLTSKSRESIIFSSRIKGSFDSFALISLSVPQFYYFLTQELGFFWLISMYSDFYCLITCVMMELFYSASVFYR